MIKSILLQLAHTDLLPTELSAKIFKDNPPPLDDLIASLLVAAGDCHYASGANPPSDLDERRASRGLLIATYLMALGLTDVRTRKDGTERIREPR